MVRELEEAASWDATPAAPGRARSLVERILRRCDQPELVPAATVVISEVVTNAVLHAGGIVEVRVSCRPDRVRVEVRDASEQLPVTGDPAQATTGGRGLHLVEALATAWGANHDGRGKVVWFELRADEHVRASTGDLSPLQRRARCR
jgi:anti-sigma regulatory factor (Ser/Thr protein kinase)